MTSLLYNLSRCTSLLCQHQNISKSQKWKKWHRLHPSAKCQYHRTDSTYKKCCCQHSHNFPKPQISSKNHNCHAVPITDCFFCHFTDKKEQHSHSDSCTDSSKITYIRLFHLFQNEDEIRQVCKELNMEIDDTMGKGKLIDEIFGEFCEGTFIQPTFITDYPVEMSPLTKMHRSKPGLTERFELMVNGKELANAYSELNDPIDQEERFKDQLRLSEKGDDEAMFIDQDFLKALQYGMPPTSGIGIGIDRLTMLMTGESFIQEVLFFPQMRPEKVIPKDAPARYTELGIPEDWVAVIQKAGYNLVSDMKDVNPQKLHMDICGINKKYKLELANPTVNEVADWVGRIKN